jgi:predicted DNA-binding transcriptional regulator AlpA
MRGVTMRHLLSFPELKSRKGINYSRQHIARLVRAKRFPQPVKLSGSPTGANSWFDDEIDEHLERRAAERAADALAESK